MDRPAWQLWSEGFCLSPRNRLTPADIEYQAVLGRGWMSPWIVFGLDLAEVSRALEHFQDE